MYQKRKVLSEIKKALQGVELLDGKSIVQRLRSVFKDVKLVKETKDEVIIKAKKA